jgi:hypothetical protein
MRALPLAVLPGFVLAATPSAADPFGRFGFRPLPSAPGWVVEAGGVRPDIAGADWIRFPRPLSRVRAALTGPHAATFLAQGGAWTPGKLRVELSQPAIEAHFAAGAAFESTHAGEPILTWDKGSAGPGVPTPPVRWVLLSYPDEQPPVLFASLGEPASFELAGRPGQWRLRTRGAWSGWLRIALPMGIRPTPGRDAAQLGLLALLVRSQEAHWTLPAPSLLSFEAREAPGGVLAIWRYDRPGASVPPAAILARAGGYPVVIRSAVEAMRAPTPVGPSVLSAESRVVLFFPSRTVPAGRAVTFGSVNEPEEPYSLSDPQLLGRLAWASLFAGSASATLAQGSGLVSDFVLQAATTVAPNTGARVPFGPDPESLRLPAAFALLEAALAHGDPWQDAARPLGASLLWAFDPFAWTLGDAEADRLMSVACALDARTEVRVLGAMLHAGLAAAEARPAWLSANALGAAAPPAPTWIDGWAEAIYGRAAGLEALLSPLRVFGSASVRAAPHPEGARLSWTPRGGRELWLAAPEQVALRALSGHAALRVDPGPGPVLVYRRSGSPVEALAAWPGGSWPVPVSGPMPLRPGPR